MRWQLQLHNGTWRIVLEPPGHRGHGNQAQDEHHQQHQRQQSHHQQSRRASSCPLAPAQPRHCLLTLVVKIPKLKTLNPHRNTFESKVHTLQSIATPVCQSQEEAYNILPVVTSLAPVFGNFWEWLNPTIASQNLPPRDSKNAWRHPWIYLPVMLPTPQKLTLKIWAWDMSEHLRSTLGSGLDLHGHRASMAANAMRTTNAYLDDGMILALQPCLPVCIFVVLCGKTAGQGRWN